MPILTERATIELDSAASMESMDSPPIFLASPPTTLLESLPTLLTSPPKKCHDDEYLFEAPASKLRLETATDSSSIANNHPASTFSLQVSSTSGDQTPSNQELLNGRRSETVAIKRPSAKKS